MSELNENPKKEENTESAGRKEPDSKPNVSGGEGTSEVSKDARMFGMLCHLLGIFTLLCGPLIVWLTRRDDDKFIDENGKEAVNWQLTVIIASAISAATFVIVIGIILGIATAICNLIFCIMGAVKANNGKLYRYPVSIRFIK